MKINKKKIICIIPARGGSKRIKNKNIKQFHNKPLIFYSIKNALSSKIFTEVYVSTDSKKIQKISKKYGANVSHLRPKKFSGDKIITKDVLINFIKNLKSTHKIDYLCCLYPTAPLITSIDLKKAYKQFVKSNADALISVGKYNNHPLRGFRLSKNKYLSFKFPKYQKKNSQDLETMYHDAGAFYFYKKSQFLKTKKNLIPRKTIPFVLNQCKVVDIDNIDDFKFAKKLFQIPKKN